MAEPHRVVVIGGGFGGLYVAKHLRRAPVEVTLIDRRNFHLFQPLLYQVAMGALSPANIASPLRAVLRKHENTRVLLAEARDIDTANRRVVLADGEESYDTLIVAAGARHHYFGHPEWEKLAPGLKTIEDATEIRRRVLYAFEAAEREPDPKLRQAWMTFVVVGGGPTGLEMAGAIGELAHHTLRRDFRNIDPAQATVLLVEGTDRILPPYPAKLSEKAAHQLQRLGATIRLKTMVVDIQPESVTLKCGEQTEQLATRTVLWAAGVQASPLGQALAKSAGAELDRAGRVVVGPNLSLPSDPNVFVIGDLANFAHQDGKPLPGVAQVAMQQGRFVADVITRRLLGKEPPALFRYRDKGSMATIGRASAVADLGWITLSGWLAWQAWLFIHVMFLIKFENRLLVMMQWAWNYWTRNRSARLITGEVAGERKE